MIRLSTYLSSPSRPHAPARPLGACGWPTLAEGRPQGARAALLSRWASPCRKPRSFASHRWTSKIGGDHGAALAHEGRPARSVRKWVRFVSSSPKVTDGCSQLFFTLPWGPKMKRILLVHLRLIGPGPNNGRHSTTRRILFAAWILSSFFTLRSKARLVAFTCSVSLSLSLRWMFTSILLACGWVAWRCLEDPSQRLWHF